MRQAIILLASGVLLGSAATLVGATLGGASTENKTLLASAPKCERMEVDGADPFVMCDDDPRYEKVKEIMRVQKAYGETDTGLFVRQQ